MSNTTVEEVVMGIPKEEKRPISLGEDFMHWKVDDILYGFMRTLSIREQEKDKDGAPVLTEQGHPQYKEYLLEAEYKKNKSLIALLCSCSQRTIDRHKEVLESRGLLTSGTIKTSRGMQKCFYFPPVDCGAGHLYQTMDRKMLKYLVYTRNVHGIKIYLYLLNKHVWKQKEGKRYLFSIHELCKALGYANTTKSAEGLIKTILVSFNLEGVIRYTDVWRDIEGVDFKVPYKQLDYVAVSLEDILCADAAKLNEILS